MHDAHDDVAATRLRRPRSLHTPPLTTASTEKPQHRIGAEALGVVLGTVGEVEKLAFRIYGSPLYFRDGVKRAEIARRLGLSRQWVTKIIKIYQTEGFDSAVAGKKRGLNEAAASEKRRLSREEEKKVANWIVDKNPAQLKFDFALWTAKAVRQLIYR